MEIKKVVNQLINDAIDKHTSDMFIIPEEAKYRYSIRTAKGVVLEKKLPLDLGKEIINFFKYISQMDISEHRRPQVGAMEYQYKDVSYYLRLSSVGNFYDQESLVVRLIYQVANSQYFFPQQLEILKKLANRRGLIITSGPTGSGKTTTMYELAREIGKNKMIMTIEDPIEIHEPDFLQTQVNLEAGISYLNLLKAALRHRPDILIIGEIRDAETARMAIDAALSGHLVLATVHAKSTLQTISRLKGLGIREDELQNCLTAVSYQRLIPGERMLGCLMDIACENQLKESIDDIKQDFVIWEDNLHKLQEKGEIDESTYRKFKQG